MILYTLSRSNFTPSFNKLVSKACLGTLPNRNLKIQDDGDDVTFGTGGKFVELDRVRPSKPMIRPQTADFSARKPVKADTDRVNNPDVFGTLTNEVDTM
jgi:hypothetical protein